MAVSVDPERIAAFHRDGFALIKGVLPREEALAMRPLLEQCIHEDIARWGGNPAYIDHWMVHNLMVRGAPFARLLENPVLHAYLEAGFSKNPIIYAYTSSSMPPNGTNYSRRIHVDCPRLIPGYATNVGFLVALDDFTEENGATLVLAGSYQRAEAPPEAEFLETATHVLPQAGDAIFLNARVWHMGGENKTDRPRHAVTMNICRRYMKQRFDYPRLVPPAVADEMSDLGRRFLGFDSRIPTSLEEYYAPADQRLYKPAEE